MSGGFRALGEQVVFDGHVISLVTATFEAPDGTEFEREIVRHPGAVSVVPVVDGSVILVRQYRAAVGRELLEIPAGKRDVEGEPPEVTANRELAEEVGYRAGQLEKLIEFDNSVGFSDEHSIVYLGRDLEPAPRELHGIEEEHMTVEVVPLDDVAELIERGAITDAKTVIGLTLALRRLGR